MGLFGRRAESPEIAELREAISHRGIADRAGARATVTAYVNEILAESGRGTEVSAQAWVWDRMRLMIIVGFRFLDFIDDKLPDLAPQLKVEYAELCRDVASYDASDLVAWWWHLHPPLFKPLVETQLDQMRPHLLEGMDVAVGSGGSLRDHMVDWESFG